MRLGRLVEAWNNYGIQMLVLMSLVLQLFLFILPIVRRHKMLEKRMYSARLLKLLLWLAYQLADTTAIYVLGHMAISSSSRLSGEVMALWASFLLVHLGGQDTITAYSLEDNQLWKRHLLTLLVQAAGVLYVLPGYEGGGRSSGSYPNRLRFAAALVFVVGFLKFVERIWVLRSSDMNKLFTRKKVQDKYKRFRRRPYEEYEGVRRKNLAESSSCSKPARFRRAYLAAYLEECAEEDLKQAHELLYFCMCQFVGSKVRLGSYQKTVIKYYAKKKRLCELVHLQLSLMHDLLYTKAAAIHTWCGFLLRVFSWLATATTCTLVFLSGSSYGGRRLDAAVTYALLAGALLLETASSLKAVGSTWTYQTLRSQECYSSNCVVQAFHRLVRAAECGLGRVALAFRRLVRPAEWSRRRCPGYIGGQETIVGVSWWSEYGQTDPNTSLFVDEIEEMVTEYIKMDRVVDHREKEKEKEKEKLMNSRGGLSLRRLLLSGDDEGKVKLIQDLEQLEFDEYLVLWYHATFEFIRSFRAKPLRLSYSSSSLRGAVGSLAYYMMYLFNKQPHMLPTPVRQETCPYLSEGDRANDSVYQNLVNELKLGNNRQKKTKLKPVLWVWIEMLCYAASHCNRESHARELSNGSPEFATVLWVVRAALINANMKPAVLTVAAASVRDKSPVATEGNNVITHDPSSSNARPLIGNHRGAVSV